MRLFVWLSCCCLSPCFYLSYTHRLLSVCVFVYANGSNRLMMYDVRSSLNICISPLHSQLAIVFNLSVMNYIMLLIYVFVVYIFVFIFITRFISTSYPPPFRIFVKLCFNRSSLLAWSKRCTFCFWKTIPINRRAHQLKCIRNLCPNQFSIRFAVNGFSMLNDWKQHRSNYKLFTIANEKRKNSTILIVSNGHSIPFILFPSNAWCFILNELAICYTGKFNGTKHYFQ